jgi:DNA replication initiation complex subunit (GINS family)
MTLFMEEDDITYKTLRKIQQAEKNSPQITKINKDFYHDVNSFLHKLEQRLEQEKKPQKQMLLAEECQNIEKIIRNIYEQREKKIMLAAISRARGGNPSINTLLHEEKTFFDELYHNIVSFRDRILKVDEKTEDEQSKFASESHVEQQKDATTITEQKKEDKQLEKKEPNINPILRIVEDIPSFVGTDNKTYTLHQKDIVSLPKDMAKMLLDKKVTIKINEK